MQQKSNKNLVLKMNFLVAFSLMVALFHINTAYGKEMGTSIQNTFQERNNMQEKEPKYLDLKRIDINEISEFQILCYTDMEDNRQIYFIKYSDSMKIFKYCTGEIIYDNISQYQVMHSAGVFKTSEHWILVDNQKNRDLGWRPHLIEASLYDEIIMLDNYDFLLKRNNKTWYGKIIANDKKEIRLEQVLLPNLATDIKVFGSGFLAKVRESEKQFWRYFELYGSFSDSKNNIVHTEGLTLDFNPIFKADSIISLDQTYNSILYLLEDSHHLYSTYLDTILSQGFNEFYIENNYSSPIIREGDTICFQQYIHTNGSNYAKMNFKNLTGVYLHNEGGDLYTGFISTGDQKEYMIFFNHLEIFDTILVSNETRNILQFKPPYREKLFFKDNSGNLYFILQDHKLMVVQSKDGNEVTTKKLHHFEQKESCTIIATEDHWEIYTSKLCGNDLAIQYDRSDFDSMSLLDNCGFLAYKGKFTYLIRYQQYEFQEPVQLAFFPKEYNSIKGLMLINVSEKNERKKLKLLINYDAIIRFCCDQNTGQWKVKPNIDYFFPGFEADSILAITDMSIVYTDRGVVKTFDAINLEIYTPWDSKYMVLQITADSSPYYSHLIFLYNGFIHKLGNYQSKARVPGATDFTARHVGGIGGATFVNVTFEDGQSETHALMPNDCPRKPITKEIFLKNMKYYK